MIYVIIFFLQICLSTMKTLEIKYTVENQVLKSTVVTFLLVSSWLFSTTIGIKSVLSNDWTVVVVYLIASVLGMYLSMTVFCEAKWLK